MKGGTSKIGIGKKNDVTSQRIANPSSIMLCLFVYLYSCFGSARAGSTRNDSTLIFKAYEDTLKVLQYGKISEDSSDAQKLKANGRFTHIFQKALELSGSFNYPFDSLKTVGIITSPDRQFRIITWDVPEKNGTFLYFGFVQSLNHVSMRYTIYKLQDRSAEISVPREAVYTPEKWLGMLYYKLIPEKYENRTIYMLLAWQGYSGIITRKIIDAVSFNEKGEPSFGMSIFTKPPPGYRGALKRLIFQYSANAYMSLTYNSKKNMIIFDHLAPVEEQLKGQYEYYAPNFTVDCITYKNSSWQYVADIDARNSSSPADKNYIDPAKHAPDMSKKNHDFDEHSLYNPNK